MLSYYLDVGLQTLLIVDPSFTFMLILTKRFVTDMILFQQNNMEYN